MIPPAHTRDNANNETATTLKALLFIIEMNALDLAIAGTVTASPPMDDIQCIQKCASSGRLALHFGQVDKMIPPKINTTIKYYRTKYIINKQLF